MTAQHGDVATGPGWELRCGRWQEALAHVAECDALITDPPYSERTHTGHDGMAACSEGETWTRSNGRVEKKIARRELTYDALTSDALAELVAHWSVRASGWMGWLTSHDLVSEYEATMREAGRMVFPPLPCVFSGMTCRLGGDGPSSESVSLVVGRPRSREMAKWGTLRGYYYGASERGLVVVGGKPLWVMRAIIPDYTRPGDLVVDPCAGGGTTLLAAVMEGRRAIGAEMDPATFDKAVARLRKGYTAPLFSEESARMEQTGLDL